MLFFPLFQLGQNTRWGSSAYLSPYRSQWRNGHCRNPKYSPHQRLPNFKGEKRKVVILISSQWIILDKSLHFCSRKPVRIPAPTTQHKHPCSQGWSWLLVSSAPSPTRVTSRKHLIFTKKRIWPETQHRILLGMATYRTRGLRTARHLKGYHTYLKQVGQLRSGRRVG